MIGLMLPIITTFLALFYLAKDWDAHRKSWRRLMVLVLIILFGITGTVNTYYSNKNNGDQRQEDQKQIVALQKAVETANASQEVNTRQFVKAFGQLSEKLNMLETKVKTAGLKEEADKLRAQLESTEKALTPPKATLTFTFPPADIDSPPVRSITLPVKNDIVHVEYHITNTTDVTAINGTLELRICNSCEFASEPKNFFKVAGQGKMMRTLQFERLLPRTIYETMSADIRVPAKSESVEICVLYRCINCDLPSAKSNCGVIRLSR